MKIALVGYGKIGREHASHLNESNFFDLVAICSRSATQSELALGSTCKLVRSIDELISNSKPDVVLVATPHNVHRDAVIPALQAGIHVICEKPMSVSAKDAAEMTGAANESNAKLTVVSQTRWEPSYWKVKSLLDSGRLGRLRRCNITETFLRSEAYYQADSWRGTWEGEGGGVLVNQAPHILDRYRWLCGCPQRITASCETLHHAINVEDSATLICSHSNAMVGNIHVSTNEQPSSRLELVGDRGRIVVDEGKLTTTYWSPSISQAILQPEPPSFESTTESLGGMLSGWSDDLLHRFYEDFANAIWLDRPPTISANEASDVVQMINAAQLSSWSGQPTELPVDATLHQHFQAEMIAKEKGPQVQ